MKSKKQHVKNESGRTMVEMLAVLGIVGLITVGSVAGFKQIMNVIRANETIERLSKRAWDISDSIIMDKTPSLAAFSPNDGSYTIDTLELGQNGFSLTVHDVQPEVCSKLVDQNISGAVILAGGDCRVTGNMVFLFNNRLETQNHDICAGFESTACIPTCDSEAGYTFAEVGTQCGPNERHVCDGQGHCIYTSMCYASVGKGYFAADGGNCVSCDSDTIQSATKEECYTCPQRSWINGKCYRACVDGEVRSQDGNCVSCSDTGEFNISKAECNRCNNRFWIGTKGVDIGRCVLHCDAGSFLGMDGVCHPCNDEKDYSSSETECNYCESRVWIRGVCATPCIDSMRDTQSGSCVLCDNPNMIYTSQDECESCVNRYYHNANNSSEVKCYPACTDNSFHQLNGECISCSAGGEYESTEAECSRCSDRTYDSVSGKCVAMCNNGFHDLAGECIDCANTSKYTSTKEECDLCTDRYWDQSQRTCFSGCTVGFHQTNGTCIECSVVGAYVSTKAECDRCTGRYWNPSSKNCHSICVLGESFRSAETHECVSCSTENDVIGMSEAECLACEGRAWDATTGKCSLNSYVNPCGNNGFLGLDGSCYNCDDNDKYPANANACNACNGAGLVNRRKMVGNNCARESCPTGYFQGSEGACISCGSTLSFSADSTECTKCTDSGTPRIMDNNNKCVPYDSTCAEGFISEQICHSCDADVTVKADAIECGKCANRYRDSSGWCLLSGTCPVNQFWSLTYDKCISCSEIIWTGSTTTGRHKTTKSECDKCGTSRVEVEISGSTDVWCDAVCPYGYFRNANRNCTDCAMDAGKETSEEECQKCNSTGWPRKMSGKNCVSDATCKAGNFPDLSGTCHSCATEGPTQTTEEACARCDKPNNKNTVAAREWIDGVCRVPICPKGKFMAKDGSCKLCTWSSWKEVDKQGIQSFEVDNLSECDVCGNLRKKVTRGGKYYCDPVCPWGQYQNSNNGNCTGCWRKLSKQTTEEGCKSCWETLEGWEDYGFSSKPDWKHTYSNGYCTKTTDSSSSLP